jgi:hypothetical protein
MGVCCALVGRIMCVLRGVYTLYAHPPNQTKNDSITKTRGNESRKNSSSSYPIVFLCFMSKSQKNFSMTRKSRDNAKGMGRFAEQTGFKIESKQDLL